MPRKEKIDITFKNPSFFLGFRFLAEINLSTFVNKVLIFKFRFNIGQYPRFHDNEGDEYNSEWKYLATHKMRGSRGNHTWGMEQAANHILWNMTGTPAPYTHWFHMRVIRGKDEAPSGSNGQYQGDYYGMLLAMEAVSYTHLTLPTNREV